MIKILLATYNGEKYIKELLNSLINQTYIDWELYIRDDNSTDKTLKILSEFEKKDMRIKILKDNLKNLGVVKNFEELLKRSELKEDDIILLCDQDDIWNKDKLLKMKYNLRVNQMVIHDATLINSKNEKIGLLSENLNLNRNKIERFFKPNYVGCCMGFKGTLIKKILPFPRGIAHDTWIGIMYNYYTEITVIDDKLISYRRHGQNVSSVSEAQSIPKVKKIKFLLKHLYEFFKRNLLSC